MNFEKLRLRNFPAPWKVFTFGYLVALSLAYVYALINVALVVGLTPKDIMIHYYGSDTKIEAVSQSEAEAEFSLDDEEAVEEKIIVRPNLKGLVAEGHFHLFGMTSFFFGLCFLGLFTSIGTQLKSVLVGLPFVTVIVDNLSFMATRFLGPQFAYLTAFAGGLMFISFSGLWIVICREIFLPAQNTNEEL